MSDIKSRFKKLQAATSRMRNSTAAQRAQMIMALWEGVQERQDDLFEATRKERGTHDLDVAAELMMIKGEAEFTAKHVAKWMKPERIKNSMSTMGKTCEIRYQSKGVVLNLSAFNAPTAECIVPMIPAIAAGNCVAVKPSELAPHSAVIIEEIINKAIPGDEVDVFQGGVEVSQELLSLPYNHVYFTGGNTVGKIVMKAAANHFASVTLEMGGKSPVIIDETANLENAATKIAWGRVMNAGQVCIAPEYVIAHESIADEFTALVKDKINTLYNSEGTGLENSNYVPRIINERHHGRIKSLIDDAVAKGATVVCGGGSDAADKYIEPTVLTDVSEDMRVMQEEVFGPVLAIIPYKTRQDVLDLIAKRPSPLALYIYSTDKAAQEFFLTNTSSGSAVVNNNCIQSGTNPRLPFGGVGASGMGRIGGFKGFQEMSNARSVVHQPLDKFRDFLIQLPPYSDKYTNIIMKAISK